MNTTTMLEQFLTRLKGRPFTIDRRVPLRILAVILIRRAVWLLRGLVKTTFLQGRPAMVFMAPRVTLRNASLCRFGKGVTLETGVLIDGLSSDGIHLGDNVSIGAYSQLRASMVSNVGVGLRFSANSSCDAYSFFGASGLISIGENVIMGQHVSFHAQTHNIDDPTVPIRLQGVSQIGIRIEEDCWIGSNTVFLDGSVVGRGCVVAAGAVVRGTIEPYSVIGGIPAKLIRKRLKPEAGDDDGKVVGTKPVQAKIGVVTVTYNSSTVLDEFLSSLTGQTHADFLLYAVDNASRDDSVERLTAWGDPRLRLIANAENVGIAEGNNQGTRAAAAEGCDFVLYLNNDVVFEPETFAAMLFEMDARRCDLLGPKILYSDRERIWSAGGGFNAVKGYLSYHNGEGELDRGQYDRAFEVRHAPACCLLVRSAVFEKIGLMDPKYFVYWDDADFSYRAWRAGLVMFYSPRARIFHKVSTLTGGATSDFTLRYNARGHVYFMLKHLGVLPCLYYIPALELRLIFKLLTRKIEMREFRVRQSGLLEGMRVWAA